jgi:hypothetical protein
MTKKRAFFDDDHDTEHDEDREDVARKTVRKKRPASDHKTPSKRTARSRPVLKGKPVAPEEALQPAPLSKVRVREAMVRIQESLESDSETDIEALEAKVPEVSIAFVRSRDKTQRIERFGRDGFRIKGTATGWGEISVGAEGHIFGIQTSPGDSPETTATRLAERLKASFQVNRPDPASAILREHPPER